jgi:hypothetical protein
MWLSPRPALDDPAPTPTLPTASFCAGLARDAEVLLGQHYVGGVSLSHDNLTGPNCSGSARARLASYLVFSG